MRALTRPVERVTGFIDRQKRNYRVAVTRSAANEFLYNLTAQYDSIYTVALGAGSVELGTVNSIGNAVAALIAVPVGSLVDRYGFKRFYVLGTGLLAGVALTYAVAPSWHALVPGMMLYTVAVRLTGTGCSVISVDSVANEDRATAQNLCAAFRSILSMLAPLVAAPLVTTFGGMTLEGIRPLYVIRFAGYALVFLLVATRLTDVTNGTAPGGSPGLRQEIRHLFEGSAPLRKWIIISSATYLPLTMTLPFMQVFAHEVKGADQYVLGAMATATILARLVFGIPLGRLADRIGRKKVIYLLTPLWYASHLLLVVSFSPVTLILAGALWTFYYIDSGITGAMALELLPVEETGKWSGLQGLFRGLVTVPGPILGGLIWEKLGPSYVFLVPVAVDLLLRLPLLATVPETLRMRRSDD
ncbi:MAG: MFS transporter [Chloroflexota bacterium]